MPVIALDHVEGCVSRGAQFETLDWSISAHEGEKDKRIWPEGSRWLWKSNRGEFLVEVKDGQVIREDGATLYTRSESHKWVKETD